MGHIDSLSRRNFIAVIEDNSLETNLIIAQNINEKIVQIRKELEKAERKFYEMRNGIIYRKIHDKLLFYIPIRNGKKILFKYQDDSGHMGTEKVITKTYWFLKLQKTVYKHTKNCYKCIAYSSSCERREGMIQSILKGNKSFDSIHIDHVVIRDT